METLAFICLFVLLPIWAGYTGENMVLWVAVALLLLLPETYLILRDHTFHNSTSKRIAGRHRARTTRNHGTNAN